MRLTADLIRNAPVYLNPLKEREISFRGHKVPVIENLGVTQDAYEVIDLCDNAITRLENFPLLHRLKGLLLSNNRISKLASGLGAFLPGLVNLTMMNNRVASMRELEALRDIPTLEHLSLVGNPVTKQENYRTLLIGILPNLKVLDFQRVKPAERAATAGFMAEWEEKRLDASMSTASDVEMSTSAPTPTFQPGASLSGDGNDGRSAEEKKQAILDAIQSATSLEEIQALEKRLQASGTL